MGDAGEARARRLRLMDVRKTEELAARLRHLRALGFHGHDEVPQWVGPSLREVWRTGSVADATLPENVGDKDVRAWIASFVRDAGIAGRFHVLTGIHHFPWMECEVQGDGWLDDLVERMHDGSHYDYNIELLAHSGDALVVIHEDEWEYLAFRRSP